MIAIMEFRVVTTSPPTLVPAPHRFGGHLKALQKDIIKSQEDALSHGDFVKVRILTFWLYYVNDPDLIQEFLVKRAKSFHKSSTVKRATQVFGQDNVFNSDGDFWKKQRRLMQPAFHSKRIGAYADDMVALTQAAVQQWQDGAVINIDAVMTDVTMRIIVKTMFNTNIDDALDEMGTVMIEMFELLGEDVLRLFQPPRWVPTKHNRRFQNTEARLTTLYQRIMDEWRVHKQDRGDLLSMLMLARYDDGTAMSDEQIMSELGTIFAAGHETTAKTLTFTWLMLSKNPEIATKLHAEVDSILGDRPATLEDLKHLTYTEQIIKETLRLYPAAISLSREAIEDVEIGGHTIKKGASMGVSFWVLHRDERWYPDPLKFDPDRWTPENEAKIPRYAYLPFGGGPRVCLGNQFAMMEAQLVLATIAQRYTLSMEDDIDIKPEFRFTLHPSADAVSMRVKARKTLPNLA